jgi:C-methyltransferase
VDSEAALRGADDALRADGPLASRCRLVPGDCLREVPYSADVYLFKWVLHQWDDDTCIRVLGNCAEYARPGARVIIAERTMSETPPPFVTLLDMLILLGQGGGVRTEAEFADLVERAGLRFIGVRPTASPVALIEAAITA